MKKIVLIGALCLVGCSAKSTKPIHHVCMTPFGTVQFDSDDPAVKVHAGHITLEQETKTVIVDRAVCTEVREK